MMEDYTKITKTINSDQRVTIDDAAMEAAGAAVGDTVEILFKVVKKKGTL